MLSHVDGGRPLRDYLSGLEGLLGIAITRWPPVVATTMWSCVPFSLIRIRSGVPRMESPTWTGKFGNNLPLFPVILHLRSVKYCRVKCREDAFKDKFPIALFDCHSIVLLVGLGKVYRRNAFERPLNNRLRVNHKLCQLEYLFYKVRSRRDES